MLKKLGVHNCPFLFVLAYISQKIFPIVKQSFYLGQTHSHAEKAHPQDSPISLEMSKGKYQWSSTLGMQILESIDYRTIFIATLCFLEFWSILSIWHPRLAISWGGDSEDLIKTVRSVSKQLIQTSKVYSMPFATFSLLCLSNGSL